MDKGELFTAAAKYHMDILNAINEIRDGKSEAEACRDNDIDNHSFRNQTVYLKAKRNKPPIEIPKNVYVIGTGYERLFAYIASKKWDSKWKWVSLPMGLEGITVPPGEFMPTDLDKTLPKVLNTLSHREKEVLKLRGIAGMSIEEVGKRFDVTRERIRQIEAKAIRKMSHPNRWKPLILGTLGNTEVEKERRSAELERLRKIDMENTAKAIEDTRNALARENMKNILNEVMKKFCDMAIDEDIKLTVSAMVGIEDMNLSVRSYTCLRRAGVETLDDLRHMTEGELRHIRNLGKKSMDEILLKMKEYGVSLKEG